MLPPLPLAGASPASASASASSWRTERGRSSERGKSDPGGLSFEERASRLAAIREAERDEQAAKQKALAKQAIELSKAAAGLAGAYQDRWRSPREVRDGDAAKNIANLRCAMEDLRRECIEARAPSPLDTTVETASETTMKGAGKGPSQRPRASSGWRQPFGGKGESFGKGTTFTERPSRDLHPQRMVFGGYSKERASYVASHKVAERVRKMGEGPERRAIPPVQSSDADYDWEDEDWYEGEWGDGDWGDAWGWYGWDGWDEGWQW
ncbi:unnamed protein product [Durusdinium trenchii]|uniref:Uncharacterized protein n=3 Tax=Durusdinium trenchii TaxID=1381693 RepID=A0ABP0NNI6_9DINO